jgi:hypothetical protein
MTQVFPFLHLETETDPVSEEKKNSGYLEFQTMDKIQKRSDCINLFGFSAVMSQMLMHV